MAVIKKTLLILGWVTVAVLVIYAYFVYQNNRDIQPIRNEVIKAHLEKATQWLVKNESEILTDANPMLWWMLFEAEKRGHDPRLTGLLNKYFQQSPSVKLGVWGPLFGGDRTSVDLNSILDLPYYNQHFIYALHCAENLARDSEVIRQQNSADFCYRPAYFFRPACATHQLMGINFLRQQACGNVDTVMQDLQRDIVRQLTWDVRVIDVYLQRVMMLIITGAEDKVKPIWVRQVLDHQREDGGWAGFVPLVPVGNGRSIGFNSKIISLSFPSSSLHTTAQGVYFLTVMSKE